MTLKSILMTAACAAAASAAFAQGPPPSAPAIPGVVAAGATWQVVATTLEGMDGIVGTPDGGVVYAQEHTSTVHKVAANGSDTVVASDTHGGGSLAMDRQGRIYAVQRTCTDPQAKLGAACTEPPMVGIVGPAPKMLANAIPGGRPLPRPADLVIDGKGGTYVAASGLYYISPTGAVSTVAEGDIRTNGIALSPDGKTLYVTNNNELIAFDVQPDGSARNRRVFGHFNDANADGMAVDSAGRVYATGLKGVHVLSPDGTELGVIPTLRRPTSLCFGGPGEHSLFLVEVGVSGPDGKPAAAPAGNANGPRTLYRLAMLAQGYAGRPK